MMGKNSYNFLHKVHEQILKINLIDKIVGTTQLRFVLTNKIWRFIHWWNLTWKRKDFESF